jgi:hypothetical protein
LIETMAPGDALHEWMRRALEYAAIKKGMTVNRRGNGPPDRRARGTPWFVTDRGGSAGLGEAGLGCAAGASADR